ncbi:hypothetical protein PRIPAC_92117, partial [Pristionchus pacificus]
ELAMNNNELSLTVGHWATKQVEQFSHAVIDGYPWRLRLFKMDSKRLGVPHFGVSLICDKSKECDLWECSVSFTFSPSRDKNSLTAEFNSWDKRNHERYFCNGEYEEDVILKVTMTIDQHGNRWNLRPTLGLLAPRNRILVIGERDIYVNKESLSSLSKTFKDLFNNNFKDYKLAEITIPDVEYDDFSDLINTVYEFDCAFTDGKARRMMELAVRFDLKIVQDRIVSYLLSHECHIDIKGKHDISPKHRFDLVAKHLTKRQTIAEMSRRSGQ